MARQRLIRRTKKQVALQMPERQDKILFVPMTKEQREQHDELKYVVGQIVMKWQHMHFLSEKDRNRLMLCLSQMRMLCDSTYILDQKTRNDTKVDEALNIITNLLETEGEKVVVFSQWERMTRLFVRKRKPVLLRLPIRHQIHHNPRFRLLQKTSLPRVLLSSVVWQQP
jgi:SNF2 family DNA or RNA helicase